MTQPRLTTSCNSVYANAFPTPRRAVCVPMSSTGSGPRGGESKTIMERFWLQSRAFGTDGHPSWMAIYIEMANPKNLIATLVGVDDDDRRWCSTTCSIFGPQVANHLET